MAHAGQEIRFGEVGFFRHELGALQFGVLVLQHLIELRPFGFDLLARGDITQNAGEVTLTTQPHVDVTAISIGNMLPSLRRAHDLASEPDGARFIARTVILE